MKFYISIFFFVFLTSSLFAQEEISLDSIPSAPVAKLDTIPNKIIAADSTKQKKSVKKKMRNFFTKDYPIPKRAMILSFVIPGAGQAYNKKWWKVPLAVGGTVSMIYVVRNNTRNYRLLRDEYIARVDLDDNTVPNPAIAILTDEDIRSRRDQWNKWKEMSYIGLVLVQALGGVDAFVDAHMYGLEITDDLSMKIKPSIESTPAFGPTVGIGLSLNLNTPLPDKPKDFFFDAK